MSNKRRRRQREDSRGGATVTSPGCFALCAGDGGSRDSLRAEGMPHQAEAKALERGAHQSGSQLSPRLANSWVEEIKGRRAIVGKSKYMVLSMMMMIAGDH